MKKPNIDMVITHDTGQYLGCYGASVKTPHLNQLARSGAKFENYFCTGPQCSPSRSSIITARYPHQNGMMGLAHSGWELYPGEMSLPMLLNSAGYETHLFGVQHESCDPRRLGYRQIDCSQRSAFAVTEKVVEFRNTSRREPFFLNIGFIETHRPFGGAGCDNDPPGNIDVPPYLPDTDAIRRDLSGLHGMVRL